MGAELQRIEHYPNVPVPTWVRIVERGGGDAYDLLFSYHHSKLVQLGQVKVYRNNRPVEYISVATMEKSLTLEVIGEADELRQFNLPLDGEASNLPMVLSSASDHPLAIRLHELFAKFPPLPNLVRFRDYLPLAVVLESEKSIVLPMPTGRISQFNPQEFFNVGTVPDDLVGCFFGPIGCAISVAVAITLLARSAHSRTTPEAHAFIQCLLDCRRKYVGDEPRIQVCCDKCAIEIHR